MPTLTLYLLEFPEPTDGLSSGPRAYISVHMPHDVEGRDKKGKSTGPHTAITCECRSIGDVEEQIQMISQDLKIIRKEAAAYFNR